MGGADDASGPGERLGDAEQCFRNGGGSLPSSSSAECPKYHSNERNAVMSSIQISLGESRRLDRAVQGMIRGRRLSLKEGISLF